MSDIYNRDYVVPLNLDNTEEFRPSISKKNSKFGFLSNIIYGSALLLTLGGFSLLHASDNINANKSLSQNKQQPISQRVAKSNHEYKKLEDLSAQMSNIVDMNSGLFINNNNTENKKGLENKLEEDEEFSLFEQYLSKFKDYNFETRWKLKHSFKVFNKHKDFLEETCKSYNVPLEFFLAKLGMEGADMDDISPSGAVGYSQLFNGAVKTSFNYVLRNNLDDGVLYEHAKKFRDSDESDEKEDILNKVKHDPQANLEAGIAYCAYLKDFFPDWSLVSAAYQIGPSKLAKIIHYHKGIETKNWWPPIYVSKENESTGRREVSISKDNLVDYIEENEINIYNLINNEDLMTYYRRDFKRSYDRLETYSLIVMKSAYDISKRKTS